SPVYVQQNEAIASHPVVIPCTAATLQTRIQLATEAHRAAAHPGGVRTTNVVKRNYWWKRMHKVCAKVVAECECCQRTRANRTWRRAASVVKWRSNLNPGELVGIDVMYLPPLEVEGCRFVGIISATCISTKWLRAVPITGFSGQQAAEALDRLFYNTVIPRVLIVDQGSNFIAADTFRSWAAKRQIRLKYFPVASSSLAGWVERPHKGLRDHLRPMLLDKEDPSLVGDNNWMTRLPRAVYAWNAASYSNNSVLSPYMMVYGIPPRIPGAELTTDDEELAQLGIDHLIDIPSWTALLQQMNDSRRITRDVTMKEYIALWCDLRDKARSSLTRRTKTTEVIRVGDFVRILRPKQPASECTIVVSVRGSVIRIVDSSHRVSDEYIGNIVLAKNDLPNKNVLLECKKSYDRDGSFPDLPAIAVTRELQQ
ncbi:gag/pol/env polyprotein, putative, partial [Perkinsus marinus ATCC 50983]